MAGDGNNSYIMSSWLGTLSAGVKRSGMPFWNAVAAISRATGDHGSCHKECQRLRKSGHCQRDHLKVFQEWASWEVDIRGPALGS